MPIRVIVIEDHPLMLKAVVQELEGHPDIEVVGTADHGSKRHRLVHRPESTSVPCLNWRVLLSNGSWRCEREASE